jgi:hypothetical protein
MEIQVGMLVCCRGLKKMQPSCPGSRDLNWTGKGLILESKTSVCCKSDYMLFTVVCLMDLLWGRGEWNSCKSLLALSLMVSSYSIYFGIINSTCSYKSPDLVLWVLHCFCMSSLPQMRHLSCHGLSFCILCL